MTIGACPERDFTERTELRLRAVWFADPGVGSLEPFTLGLRVAYQHEAPASASPGRMHSLALRAGKTPVPLRERSDREPL
jgi:hypothetical protein